MDICEEYRKLLMEDFTVILCAYSNDNFAHKHFIDVRYVEELLKYELDSRSSLVMVFVLGLTFVSLLVSLIFSGELGSSSD